VRSLRKLEYSAKSLANRGQIASAECHIGICFWREHCRQSGPFGGSLRRSYTSKGSPLPGRVCMPVFGSRSGMTGMSRHNTTPCSRHSFPSESCHTYRISHLPRRSSCSFLSSSTGNTGFSRKFLFICGNSTPKELWFGESFNKMDEPPALFTSARALIFLLASLTDSTPAPSHLL